MTAMEARPWFAASGALVLHALAIAAALSIAGPQALREFVRPVQVALLEPPKPEPPPEPPRPLPPRVEAPKPVPVQPASPVRPPPQQPAPPAPKRRAPPKRAEPPPQPSRPVVAAAPVEAPRPAAITAAPAPAAAPVAPRVAQGVPAPAPSAPAPPAPAGHSPAPAQRTAPRFDASWAGNSPPAYPAMARRLGEEGEVHLDVQVGPQGNVLDVRLKKSSGSALLDQTAIETVKKWRFSPATVDGKPVAEWYYNWKWVFKLES
jgi:protein TonB